MRLVSTLALCLGLGLVAAGCSPKEFDGPTVKELNGRLTAGGKPVSFPAGEEVRLELFHEKAQSFKVPIQPDGTFKIGWMPTGKYSATLTRPGGGGKGGGPKRHGVPGGLTVVDGQTEYKIDLGKDYKP